MTKKLTSEELAEYQEAFALFDKNSDGMLTKKEIESVFSNCDPFISEDQMPQVLGDLGITSGSADYDQFTKAIWKKMELKLTEEELVEAFKAFDSEGNGKISIEDWGQILKVIADKEMEPEQMQDFLRILREDFDGKEEFDFRVFVKKMKSTCF